MREREMDIAQTIGMEEGGEVSNLKGHAVFLVGFPKIETS